MSETKNLAEWVSVCQLDELEVGSMYPFETDGKWIVVYHVDKGLFATDNICSHAFALLSDGWMEDDTVECPLHGALFNIQTGAVERGPASCAIKTYPVKVTDGTVMCSVLFDDQSEKLDVRNLT